MCSDSFSKINEPLLVLELFLASSEQKCGKDIKRVVIEMSTDEARYFVGRLQAIEKEVVSSSQ